MTSKFQKMWEDAAKQVRTYERVHDQAVTTEICRAAMTVLNRHGLAQEFVDEMLKPKDKK